MNARTKRNIETLDPKAKNAFTKFSIDAERTAADLGYEYIGINGNRTWKQQDELHAQGRTKPGKIVTNARGGESNHNFGIAMDYGVFKNGRYIDETNSKAATKVHKAIAKDCADYGLEWGGNWVTFKDEPHFQIKTDLSMNQKRSLYRRKGSVL